MKIVGVTLKEALFPLYTQHAVVRSSATPESGYSGGMATLDVHRFPNLENGAATAAIIWVSSYENDDRSDLNEIQAGWTVSQTICQHYTE